MMPFEATFAYTYHMPSICGFLFAIALGTAPKPVAPPLTMTQLMQKYASDYDALERLNNFRESSSRLTRLRKFVDDYRKEVDRIDFESLDNQGRADWLVMQIELQETTQEVNEQGKVIQEGMPLHPFLPQVVAFHDKRISRTLPDPQRSAADLTALEKDIRKATSELRTRVESKKNPIPEYVATRGIRTLQNADRALVDWYEHFAGYDPQFTWWAKRPYEDVRKALDAHTDYISAALTEKSADPNKIVGRPVGREALIESLRQEMIDYTPEELIAIAEREMAWVDQEFKKAAKELGHGDDWRAALEHVKTLHEEPGNQPRLIRELAEEAIDYLETNNLVTIPPLAKEVWRMDMMSPARQLESPFFLGGESIMISFPTDTMTHEQKLMSLRANNRYFAKATVHHELIPGHHLQFFMNERYNPHRSNLANTPFWVEGYALYWEFLLYKRGFAATPEEKIGFLFWRKHRCARIIFSLKFHLGQMTPQQCIEMLVNVVGHEQSTAEGEVRRSVGPNYPPLYQAAYMLGAFQAWQLRREFVETGKIPEKEFHDLLFQNGNMPWAIHRKLLSDEKVTKELKPWKFYNGPVD